MRRCFAALLLFSTLFAVSDLDSPRPPAPGPAGDDAAAVQWPSAESPPEGWLDQANRDLAAREYHASENAEGLQAPNRAHDLRTYFGTEGIRVLSRTATEPTALLAMRLASAGREGRMAPVAAGVVHPEGARVEIRRDGIVEWYENSPAGLEQGFTIAARPAGRGDVVVELVVEGAQVRAAADGVAELECAGGRRLRYDHLVAFDARGRALPARMHAEAGTIRLAVADDGAEYPIVIDPLFSSTFDTQLNLAQLEARYGHFVAGAGDVNGDGYADVLVGAELYDAGQTNEGTVFLYLGSAAGIMTNTIPSAMIQGDTAGALLSRCASAGDVNGDGYSDIIVGAHGLGFGQAFLYHGGPAGIPNGNPASASTTLFSSVASTAFGVCVSSAGDVNGDGYSDVIVGATEHGNSSGAAFVFMGSASGVPGSGTATAPTVLQSSQVSSAFGFSVACAGDVNADGYSDVIVGAYAYDFSFANEGGAFVFLGSATGIASGGEGSAASTLRGNQASALLGLVVAGAGDVNGDGYADVVEVASSYDGGQVDEGIALVHHGSATGIVSGIANITANSVIQMDQASANVSTAAGVGDVNGDGYADVLVGSMLMDIGQADEGAAFLFLGSASGVGPGSPANADVTLQSNQAGASFGRVAGLGDIDGDGFDDVIVGAPLFDSNFTNQGVAWIYRGGNRGIVAGSDIINAGTFQSNQVSGWLGRSVAGAGDVNGDGYADVIVGAPMFDLGQTNEGAAFLFLGSPTGVASANPVTAAATIQSDLANVNLGESVAGAGDVNGDGYADVIVGCPGYTNPLNAEGAAFIFLGSAGGVASGTPATAATTIEGNSAAALLGSSVAGAGDVNGDGYGDVIIGAYGYAGPGAAFVYHGSASGIPSGTPSSAATQILSNQANAEVGWSVAGAGDVNGDGYADVVVGAPDYDQGSADEGAAFVFYGSGSGVPNSAGTVIESNQAGAHLGWSVAAAGDVNRDGYADVVIGAYRYGANEEGAAFVFHGGPGEMADGTPATANATLTTVTANSLAGSSVAGAGDVNGDGYADVIVGLPGFLNFGAAWIYRGGATGIVNTAIGSPQSNQTGAQFGYSVAGAGDVNGDGFGDVIVGAFAYDSGQTDEGAAFVFHGNDATTGRPVGLRQRRVDGSALPVASWGSTHGEGIRVTMNNVDPQGRAQVRLQVESCPNGVPFGSGSCTIANSGWTDTDTEPDGAVVVFDIFPTQFGLQHWRARTQRIAHSATRAGITAPPNPRHGPWRRLDGQHVEADVRILELTLAVGDPVRDASFALAPLRNPARGQIVLSAMLPDAGEAEVEVFDVVGRRRIAARIHATGAGPQTFRIDAGRTLESGVYLLRLSQNGRAATSRVVFIR